ncbi:MAG: hypothetical protein ACE3JK_07690 [Sporolactobacillus sp.]
MSMNNLIHEIERINHQIEHAADDISDEMLSLFKNQKKSLEKQYQRAMLRQELLVDAEQIVQAGIEELNQHQEKYDEISEHIHSIRKCVHSDFKGETGKAIDATLHEQSAKIGSYLKDQSLQFCRTLMTNDHSNFYLR